MTPKQRVLRKHPEAYSEALTETCWYVYGLSIPSKIEIPLGTGMTARAAWANAETSIKSAKKNRRPHG